LRRKSVRPRTPYPDREWVFDALFGTSPWALIVCLLLGFIAGVWNVMRVAQTVNKAGAPPEGES
jgi:F0F1-type ATP synthase assembly protein I